MKIINMEHLNFQKNISTRNPSDRILISKTRWNSCVLSLKFHFDWVLRSVKWQRRASSLERTNNRLLCKLFNNSWNHWYNVNKIVQFLSVSLLWIFRIKNRRYWKVPLLKNKNSKEFREKTYSNFFFAVIEMCRY